MEAAAFGDAGGSISRHAARRYVQRGVSRVWTAPGTRTIQEYFYGPLTGFELPPIVIQSFTVLYQLRAEEANGDHDRLP